MFDESQPTPKAAKGRMAASLLGSVVLYGTLVSVVLAATAAVKHAVTEDKMVQIDFVPPPLPELEEAPTAPAPPPKKKEKKRMKVPATREKVVRDELSQPDEIPEAVPDESEGDLVPGEGTGPVDGYLDGVEGGTGTEGGDAPEGDGEIADGRYERPRILRRPPHPDYPEQARTARIEGTVLVRCVVDRRGRNTSCRAIRGHELLRPTAVAYVGRFELSPARRGDGTVDSVAQVFPVRFEARNL